MQPWHQGEALRCWQVQRVRQHHRHCIQKRLFVEDICNCGMGVSASSIGSGDCYHALCTANAPRTIALQNRLLSVRLLASGHANTLLHGTQCNMSMGTSPGMLCLQECSPAGRSGTTADMASHSARMLAERFADAAATGDPRSSLSRCASSHTSGVSTLWGRVWRNGAQAEAAPCATHVHPFDCSLQNSDRTGTKGGWDVCAAL